MASTSIPIQVNLPDDWMEQIIDRLVEEVYVEKRELGEWIRLDMCSGMEQYWCSICDTECYVPECMGKPMYRYCPNCGARMDMEDDEQMMEDNDNV